MVMCSSEDTSVCTNVTVFQRERNTDAAPCPLTAADEMGCVFTFCVHAVIMNHNRAFGGGC